MASTLNQVQEDFPEAANHWNLEKLYIDLASSKGKGLTPVEKKILRGLLCGYSPSEIANIIYKTRISSSVRVYLSNYLYKYLETLLSLEAGELIKINHWSRVTTFLEKAGYKNKPGSQATSQTPTELNLNSSNLVSIKNNRSDWGEAIDVGIFYGRKQELAQLEQWIVTDRCRLVTLLGMGGMGKTALSVRIAQQVQDKFDRTIWRSLRHLPPLTELLANLIQLLCNEEETEINLPKTVAGRISRLIECLRASRCLLVLDSVDSVLEPNTYTGNFLSKYQDYGELFKRAGEVFHQSCLVLTSREKIKEISSLEGVSLPARCLHLNGLKEEDCQQIIDAKGVSYLPEEAKALIERYAGNPLALKVSLTTIKELFAGEVGELLKHNLLGFGGVRELLDQHLNRLSDREIEILKCLINQEELNLNTILEGNIVTSVSRGELIEILESLGRRSLIYKSANSFKAQPIFRQYLKEKLLQQTNAKNFSNLLTQKQPKPYQIPGKLNTSPDPIDTESFTGEQYFKGNQPLPYRHDGSW